MLPLMISSGVVGRLRAAVDRFALVERLPVERFAVDFLAPVERFAVDFLALVERFAVERLLVAALPPDFEDPDRLLELVRRFG